MFAWVLGFISFPCMDGKVAVLEHNCGFRTSVFLLFVSFYSCHKIIISEYKVNAKLKCMTLPTYL